MAYLVLKSQHQEVNRRALQGSILVGRAPDCVWVIRDLMLSRHHCRFDETPDGCTITDLASKNGTYLNGQLITAPTILREGDVLRLGRSKIIFHVGNLDADLAGTTVPARPAEPTEALTGTVAGMDYFASSQTPPGQNSPHPHPTGVIPSPAPHPPDPEAYEKEDVAELLSAIASSSWDSIYAEAKKPLALSHAMTDDKSVSRRLLRPRSPVDLSLQASAPAHDATDETTADKVADLPPLPPATPPARPTPLPRYQLYRRRLLAIGALLWLLAALFIVLHLITAKDRPSPATTISSHH